MGSCVCGIKKRTSDEGARIGTGSSCEKKAPAQVHPEEQVHQIANHDQTICNQAEQTDKLEQDTRYLTNIDIFFPELVKKLKAFV